MTATSPGSAAIDVDHLVSFTAGDSQLERELFTLYLSTAEVYLVRMREAIGVDRDWCAAAHALKGASANMGAVHVAALAATAETVTPDGSAVDQLAAAVDDVRSFVDRRHTRVT